ncbi:unnamed protein product [Chrysoparadoxa australica]
MPISEFVARVKQELQDKERKKKEKETKKPDKEKETKQRKSVESSSSGATGTRTSKPRAVNRSSDSDVVTKWGTLRDTTKGSLINRLLCRWKYIRTWPDADALQGPPMDHLEMEGFPGVYVCVKGDNIGRIMDVRDSKSCPNFKNMLKKSSSELQKLLIKALKAQREEFVQHWGEGKPVGRLYAMSWTYTQQQTAWLAGLLCALTHLSHPCSLPSPQYEREIKKELRWAKDVKPDDSDKEAKEALGKIKFS